MPSMDCVVPNPPIVQPDAVVVTGEVGVFRQLAKASMERVAKEISLSFIKFNSIEKVKMRTSKSFQFLVL